MMVKKLQTLVGFTYHFSLSPRNLRRLVLPEAQILSLIVVATKLIFPFDDQKRYPTSAAEPAAQALDWSLWARAQKDYEEIFSSDGRLGKGKPILVSESDVFSMTDQQVDDYLDWYESSWLDKTRRMLPVSGTGPLTF
jgi:RNA polymerase I-specific transcription initiation factor RRN7